MKRAHVIFAGIAILFGGLIAALAPGTAAAPPERDPLTRLRLALERKFSGHDATTVQWGVEILSLDRKEMIYEKNRLRLYTPASNQKLLTAAVALIRLGPEYRFETRIEADGPVVEGTLQGSLVIRGSGDPTGSGRFQSGDSSLMFKEWAARLKKMGIRAIHGDLLGDIGRFEAPAPGSGWEWDDLLYGYAAPASPLQFNDNLISVEILPGDREGIAASIRCHPLDRYLTVDASVLTGPPGSETKVEFERIPSRRETISVRGSVPLHGKPLVQTIAVQLPTEYYLQALKSALQAEGLDVSDCSIKAVRDLKPERLSTLWVHTSPPLGEILKPLLKASQNLYAETLVLSLGLAVRGEGSYANGKEVVEETLGDLKINRGTFCYADGSGLSRRNLASAHLLVSIFEHFYRQKLFDAFYDSLAVAGVDGTLANRLKGTKAEGNARAKTGSMANVSALSGYVRTADGEMLAFSMLANNFLVSGKSIELIQDAVLEMLAGFSRK
jgi:D-alanyl-D-alanine carboxypeptidase/D-alanyl-D-alanine-endopeptidase (penicillin-binding protein 4)